MKKLPAFLAPYLKGLAASGLRGFELRPVSAGPARFRLSARKAREVWRDYLARPGAAAPRLYLHMLYCRRRCVFCKYKSLPLAPGGVAACLRYLLAQAEFYAPAFRRTQFASLYFGGGTPSLLSPAQVRAFFPALRKLLKLRPGAAVSFELNLGDCRPALLRALKAAGVNRLSIGVQTLDRRLFAGINRDKYAVGLKETLAAARRLGFSFVNLDLILGLPGDTPARALRSLDEALAAGPTGLTCYRLQAQPAAAGGKAAGRAAAAALEAGLRRELPALARRRGYELRDSAYCFEFMRPAEIDPAYREALYRMFNDRLPVLGLGRFAVSSIFGVLEYENLDGASAPEAPGLAAELRPVPGEIARFMCGDFARGGYAVGLKAFRETFGADFRAHFGARQRRLEEAGLLSLAGGRAALTVPPPAADAAVLYRIGAGKPAFR